MKLTSTLVTVISEYREEIIDTIVGTIGKKSLDSDSMAGSVLKNILERRQKKIEVRIEKKISELRGK